MDSTCLLFVLLELGFKPALAHCNYNLRGQESDKEVKFARDLAVTLNLTLHQTSYDTADIAISLKKSIQETARELRYEWFQALSKEFGYDKILTAHHLNDQAETMLYNFTKGSGLRGLVGMKPVNGLIVRPLLAISKKEIESYVTENNILYCTDQSNQDNKYDRNFIRLNILPQLERINPGIYKTLSEHSKIYASQHQLIETYLQDLKTSYVTYKDKMTYIQTSQLLSKPGFDAILYEMLNVFGYSRFQIEQISAALGENKQGAVFMSAEYIANIHQENLHILSLPDYNQAQETSYHITIGAELAVLNYVFALTPIQETEVKKDGSYLILNEDEIRAGVTIRTWKEGDKFKPEQLKGKSKKLSDFFNDKKMSVLEKKRTLVVEISGKVVWIPGYSIDYEYSVRNSALLEDHANYVLYFTETDY
jgi:tRNA(Ile)-lysidine synthase